MVKMPTILKVSYRFNANLSRQKKRKKNFFFSETDMLILTFIWKHQGLRIAKIILKNKVRGFIPQFRNLPESYSNPDSVVPAEAGRRDQQTRELKNKRSCEQPAGAWRSCQGNSVGKWQRFRQTVLGFRLLHHLHYVKQWTQKILNLKLRVKTTKLLEKNKEQNLRAVGWTMIF